MIRGRANGTPSGALREVRASSRGYQRNLRSDQASRGVNFGLSNAWANAKFVIRASPLHCARSLALRSSGPLSQALAFLSGLIQKEAVSVCEFPHDRLRHAAQSIITTGQLKPRLRNGFVEREAAA